MLQEDADDNHRSKIQRICHIFEGAGVPVPSNLDLLSANDGTILRAISEARGPLMGDGKTEIQFR